MPSHWTLSKCLATTEFMHYITLPFLELCRMIRGSYLALASDTKPGEDSVPSTAESLKS